MAASRVQGVGYTETAAENSNPRSKTITSSTAGTLLAVVVQIHGSASPTVTVTDSASSTYVEGPAGNGSGSLGAVYYLLNNPGGITSITVTPSQSCSLSFFVWEWSGIATASATDGSASGGPTSSTSVASGSFSTANATDLLLGLFGWANGTDTVTGTPTFGSGSLTQETLQVSVTGHSVSLQPVYLVVSSTGAFDLTATLTSAAYWTAQGIAFKVAGSASYGSSLQTGFNPTPAASAQTYSGTLGTAEDWVAVAAVYSAPTLALPGQPAFVTASAGNAQAALNWTAPASGGAPASYTVTPYIGASAQTPITGISAAASYTVTPYIVTTLANGTAYTFTVTAVNATGSGTASAASNAVTPEAPVTVPSTPAAPTALPGSNFVVVIVAPPYDGGSAILYYTFNCYQSGTVVATWSQAAVQYTFLALTNGVPYTFTAFATNAQGESGESSATSATPLYLSGPTGVFGSAPSIPFLPL